MSVWCIADFLSSTDLLFLRGISPYHSIKLEIFSLNFSNTTLVISVSMNTSDGKRVARWVSATMLIFASLQLSGKSVSKFCPFGITVVADQIIPKWCIVSFWAILEAIRWGEQRPENPTILVEGVNNTLEKQKLVWTYVTERSEDIDRVTFQRQRDNADPAEDIAVSSKKKAFNVFNSNYTASTPATLILRNPVTNDDEFIYSIVISLYKNDLPAQSLSDKVQLIVFGK